MKRSDEQFDRSNKYMSTGPNFGDAMQMDQALYQMAAYDFAKGLIMVPETAEQAIEMQKSIAKRFNYFKRLIQNNEVSFVELQRSVVDRNGPFPSKTHNMTSEEAIEKVIEDSRTHEDPPQAVVNVLQKLFEDIVKMNGQDHRMISSHMDDENIEDEEDQEDMNPYLFPKTDTPIDSNPTDNRVLPKTENEEKPSKGKNGRNTKSKSGKNPKDKKDT